MNDGLHPKLEAFLETLEGVRRVGRGFVARCPAHEDKDPSLSIVFDDRGIGLHCFAGCSPESILEATHLTWADLFFDDKPSNAKPRRRDWRAIELETFACAVRLQHEPKVLEKMRFGRGWAASAMEKLGVGWDGSRLTLPVRSADLKLHDVLRYDPFTQRRKVIAGKGKSRLPWPSPEYLDEKKVLFLVEGEGTAISMTSVGLTAVALPGSVSKPTTSTDRPGRWQGAGWHPKWVDRFRRFREVVCLPDCDAQGRALMSAASYDLVKAGVNTNVIDIGPGGTVTNLNGETVIIPPANDGRDIADHLLRTAWDGVSRKIARDVIRLMVAERAEVLVA